MSREVRVMHDYTVLLRAVAVTMPATQMLYTAASLLTPGRNKTDRAVNDVLLEFVARLLGLPTDSPEVVARVLRNLPPE